MNLDNIDFILISYICLLFSLCVHEAAHAAMADFCGDPSARLMGRVTLNPIAHIDPIGTVVMPLLMMFTGIQYLFGWAKPVPFNPVNLGNIRRDPVFIALAGPASNFIIMVIALIVTRIVWTVTGSPPNLVGLFLLGMVSINFVLMIFNMIPVPPLDGHHVLYYFLPPSGQRILEQIGPFGIIIAIIVARPLFRPLGGVLDFLFFTVGAGY